MAVFFSLYFLDYCQVPMPCSTPNPPSYCQFFAHSSKIEHTTIRYFLWFSTTSWVELFWFECYRPVKDVHGTDCPPSCFFVHSFKQASNIFPRNFPVSFKNVHCLQQFQPSLLGFVRNVVAIQWSFKSCNFLFLTQFLPNISCCLHIASLMQAAFVGVECEQCSLNTPNCCLSLLEQAETKPRYMMSCIASTT